MCLLCVSGHSEYFLRNLLRGWDPGRPPPPVGTNSQLSPFFFDGTPKLLSIKTQVNGNVGINKK